MPRPEFKSVSLDADLQKMVADLQFNLSREWTEQRGIETIATVPDVLRVALKFYKDRRNMPEPKK